MDARAAAAYVRQRPYHILGTIPTNRMVAAVAVAATAAIVVVVSVILL
jgi:hypothetical protein